MQHSKKQGGAERYISVALLGGFLFLLFALFTGTPVQNPATGSSLTSGFLASSGIGGAGGSYGTPASKQILRIARPMDNDAGKPRFVSPFGPGMEQELLNLFFQANDNYKVRWIVVRTREEAMAMLANKRVDMVTGFTGELSAEAKNIGAQSPVFASFYPVLVHADNQVGDGFYSIVQSAALNDNLYSSLIRKLASENNAKNLVLVDPAVYSLLAPLNANLRNKGSLKVAVNYRWFWNAENLELNEAMQKFWNSKRTKREMAKLEERYYGFLPNQPRKDDLQQLGTVVAGGIDEYSDVIIEAAAENGLDPLLLTAVIFQESRFDPTASSQTGVRGLMQLTTATADMLGVDRLDPRDSIRGGAKYLRDIWNSMEGLEISDWDRWCLALAGYNMGPANLSKAISLAQDQGIHLSWSEMRRVYATFKSSGLASKNFRPKEVLAYVEKVRYYYYVLSGLSSIAGPEHKDLASLLPLAGAS